MARIFKFLIIIPPIRLPTPVENELFEKNFEHKLGAWNFFSRCQKIIRDLKYYTEFAFISEEINENIYKQIKKIKEMVILMNSGYKTKVDEYVFEIQKYIRIFREIEIEDDYYGNLNRSIRKYKEDIRNSWVPISDVKREDFT
jgi:hypothetical protein